ncbi:MULTISPECIES: hemerythrin domain-containing protein [Mesorhizobium]|jgi:hypothetical protein|uniref:Hemerythrin-like domain-containing protein n=1 Tax=Rhizobium loti TaxID=381 RepID=A0A6M7TX28_RHILI|nr:MULTISPECIES: hemerythrin domain-containing protein [Mesorhizobium]KRB20993.1 hypothetical protein ASE05_20245 [Mesorhizobium sp. Root172]OBQ65695.1 hypothetical protein A8145_16230 [Mesorhizobium loti]QKC68826.1 hypothetical protein EB815_06560 [Mesorhizobium loti]QKC88137.1 hypothetical protein EB230_06540 [Mesorhizobium sp. NZP2234]
MTHARIPDLNGRYDLYGLIHKGLRKAQCELLARLGSADFDDAAATAPLLADLRTILMLGASHLAHEDRYIHQPLEARVRASTDRLEHQHDDHRLAFAELEDMIRAIEEAPLDARASLGRRLYIAFTVFVGHDLEHMHEEETVTAPQLWANFTDAELQGIEMAIIGSLTPEKNLAFMRLMIPAMSRSERAALLGGMKVSAPADAFAAVIEFAARPHLSREDFCDLSSRLGLAA